MTLPDEAWDELDAWTPGAGARIKLPERIEKLMAEVETRQTEATPPPDPVALPKQ